MIAPLARRPLAWPADPPDQRDDVARAVSSLRDLEFARAAGTIAPADYVRLRASLERDAFVRRPPESRGKAPVRTLVAAALIAAIAVAVAVFYLPPSAGDRAPGETVTGTVPQTDALAALEARAGANPSDVPTQLALADAYVRAPSGRDPALSGGTCEGPEQRRRARRARADPRRVGQRRRRDRRGGSRHRTAAEGSGRALREGARALPQTGLERRGRRVDGVPRCRAVPLRVGHGARPVCGCEDESGTLIRYTERRTHSRSIHGGYGVVAALEVVDLPAAVRNRLAAQLTVLLTRPAAPAHMST